MRLYCKNRKIEIATVIKKGLTEQLKKTGKGKATQRKLGSSRTFVFLSFVFLEVFFSSFI
jgi:hypothetical protein